MKQYLLLIFLVIFSLQAPAQHYKWLKGGGSNDFISNGGTQGEMASSICKDDNGNVYVVAQIGNNSIKADTLNLTKTFYTGSVVLWHILLASYDCNGKMRFAKVIESSSDDLVGNIIYSTGKIYISANLSGANKRIGGTTFNNSTPASIIKFDTSGAYNLTTFCPGKGGYIHLAADGVGNIHTYYRIHAGQQLMPSVISQGGSYDLKYDVNGTLLSATKMQLFDTVFYVRKATIDKTSGISYTLMRYEGVQLNRTPTVIAAHNPNGSLLWMDTTSPNGFLGDLIYAPNDNGIYATFGASQTFKIAGLTGSKLLPGNMSGLLKLDLNGKGKWIYKIDGTIAINSQPALAMLYDHSLMTAGNFGGKIKYKNDSLSTSPAEGNNPILINIDTAGNLIAWDQLHGSGSDEGVFDMVVDKTGSIFYAGRMNYDMAATGLPKVNSNGGNSDFMVGKYGYNCNCNPNDTPTSSYTYVVQSNAKKIDFTYTGSIPVDSVVWDFGDGKKATQNNVTHTYVSGGLHKVCATAYRPCGKSKSCKLIEVAVSINDVSILNDIRIFPNPVNDIITIEGLTPNCSIWIYNLIGQQVYHNANISTINIDVQSWNPGVYMLCIETQYGFKAVKRVLKQ